VDYEFLRVERDGDVVIVHVDRPPVNALDPSLLAEGAAMLEELRADPPPAVVIAGREGCFCAGADLKLVPTLDADGQREMVEGINRLFGGWYSFERPVVTAVTGHAIAGGFILALCGDVRVAATLGKHGLTEVRAGLPYPAAAMAVVRAELSAAAARELVLGGELWGPERALELGAFDEVVAPVSVIPRAVEHARRLAEIPAQAYGAVKRQLRAPAIEEMAAALRGEDPLAGAWTSGETAGAAEGLLRKGTG
jgi:enoyl-CoA hydratase